MVPQSQYERIVSHFRALILEGSLTYGQALPTVSELTRTFGVSRATVAKAMKALQDESLVEGRGRGGTVVSWRSNRFFAFPMTPDENVVVGSRVLPALDEIADALRIPRGDPVMVFYMAYPVKRPPQEASAIPFAPPAQPD